MTTENTVQLIPEKVFNNLSGNWYGPVSYGCSGEFQYPVQVQPVKYDGKTIAFGLHKTRDVTEFIIFNTPHPFTPEMSKKNTIVFRIAGGEVRGTMGAKQDYYNRLIEPSHKKVLYKPGVFRAFAEVISTIDQIARSYHIETMPKSLPLSEILVLEPIVAPSEVPVLSQVILG